jgi:hypothetical protein
VVGFLQILAAERTDPIEKRLRGVLEASEFFHPAQGLFFVKLSMIAKPK